MFIHLKDYEVMIDIKITNEGLVNFCLFPNCDSILYEEVASDEKWIQVMNEEIQLIENNNIRELTTLPIKKKWVLNEFIRQNINLMVKLIDLRQDWLQKDINISHILIILNFLHQLLDQTPFT